MYQWRCRGALQCERVTCDVREWYDRQHPHPQPMPPPGFQLGRAGSSCFWAAALHNPLVEKRHCSAHIGPSTLSIQAAGLNALFGPHHIRHPRGLPVAVPSKISLRKQAEKNYIQQLRLAGQAGIARTKERRPPPRGCMHCAWMRLRAPWAQGNARPWAPAKPCTVRSSRKYIQQYEKRQAGK